MIPPTQPNLSPWVATAQEIHHTGIRFLPGRVYRFNGMQGTPDSKGNRRWVFPPGLYRLLGSGPNVRTYQELVCYVGAGGKDDGKLFMCPLADFADNFELVSEVAT